MFNRIVNFFEANPELTSWLETLAIALSLVFVAFLVNRFAPSRRPRIRQSTILFLTYLVTTIAYSLLVGRIGDNWTTVLLAARELSEAFTVTNIATLLVFDLILPALNFQMVAMSVDLLVASIYFLAALSIIDQIFGLSVNQILGFLGFGGGALVISQQDTLGAFLGGIGLQFDNSVHVGDIIQFADGKWGVVRSMGWRHCKIETEDWDTIIVPNLKLFTEPFVIEGKRKDKPLQRRFSVHFNVDFRYSPNIVIDVVQKALIDSPIRNVAMDPAPRVLLDDLAKQGIDSVAYYAVYFWVIEITAEASARSAVRQRVHAALKRNNIQFARPAFFHATDDSDDRAEAKQRQRHEEVVKQVSLFNSLSDAERSLVVDSLQHMPFIAGETMVKQGDTARYLYIMLTGSANIQLRVEGAAPKIFETLEAPCVFGEMGLMTGEARANDVIAKTNVDCYTLGKDVFDQLIRERPEMAKELSEILAHRRVELVATKEGLDEEAKRNRKKVERESILKKMEIFFGLQNPTPPKQL